MTTQRGASAASPHGGGDPADAVDTVDSRPIDGADLRRALGTFATGVTVVTTRDGAGAPRGFTANSFTSVSLDPPLVLVCLARTAGSYDVFVKAGHFAVNILAEDQQQISALFAAAEGPRFTAVTCREETTGAPILAGTVSWLDCRMHRVVEAGDHAILIGRVVDYAYGPARPLGYCRGAYVSFGLYEKMLQGAAAAHTDGAAPDSSGMMETGAIIDDAGRILLHPCADGGGLTWPRTRDSESDDGHRRLLDHIADLGVEAVLSFLFAVYDDPETGNRAVVYRGGARRIAAAAEEYFIPYAAIDWDRITDRTQRTTLQRYVRERGAIRL